jgi:hypothetical protein
MKRPEDGGGNDDVCCPGRGCPPLLGGPPLPEGPPPPGCYVHHRRLPDLGDVGICGFFYKM